MSGMTGKVIAWPGPTANAQVPAATLSASPQAVDATRGGMSEPELDQALVQRVQAGERRAFDLLVRRYQHKVLGIVGRYLADWAECQDVAQEVFIRAFRAIGNFRGESSFYTWLYKIATNTAKNHLVSLGRRPPGDDLQLEDAQHLDSSLKLKDAATPERELLRAEIERNVSAAVTELPEELRQAITLREVDGLSYEEIADVMSCPIGTVRSRIFRAREAIEKRIRPLITENEVGT